MQTTTKKKIKAKGVSRFPGNDSKQRKSIKQSATGHRELLNGKNDATCKHLVPFALKPFAKELPYLSVASLQGEESKYGSEEIQLQIIKDLYPCISSMQNFKVVEFDHLSKPSEVLSSLIKQFDSFGRFENWSLVNIEGKFRLKAMNTYGGEKSIHIAVDFLSQINRSHKRLHDFIIYALRLVQNTNGVPLHHDWCMDKHPGMFYEYFMERKEEFEGEDEYLKIVDTLAYYGSRGVPTAYSRLLRGVSSFKIFKKEIESFEPRNDFEVIALPFLKSALELAQTGKKMHDYCDDPYNEGTAKPNDYMQVIWSWEDDDLMYQTFNDKIDSMAQGVGVVGFCWSDIIDETGLTTRKEDIGFCDKIEAFFRSGQEMSLNIKKELKGVIQQSPLPLKEKNKYGKLINILV